MTDSHWAHTPLLKFQWAESVKECTHWDSGANWLHQWTVLPQWPESTTNRSTAVRQEWSQPIKVVSTHMRRLGQVTRHPSWSAVSCAATPRHRHRVPTVSYQKLPSLLACFPPMPCKAVTSLVNWLTTEQQSIVIKNMREWRQQVCPIGKPCREWNKVFGSTMLISWSALFNSTGPQPALMCIIHIFVLTKK